MSEFFFSGSFDAKLDQKGRFVLPQQFRYGLVENGKLEFTLALGLGGCLALYRRSDIAIIIEKFKKHIHEAKFQKFFTLFFSTLHETTCDSIGRLSIPKRLKEAVGIDKDITLAGVLNKIEVWPKENYDRNLNLLLQGKDKDLTLAKLTEDAFSLLIEQRELNERTYSGSCP